MIQPSLSAAAELQALLVRYDYGAMPPGVAARVAALSQALGQTSDAQASAFVVTVMGGDKPDHHYELQLPGLDARADANLSLAVVSAITT